jgi:uncharacterized protein (TIGR02594 family)
LFASLIRSLISFIKSIFGRHHVEASKKEAQKGAGNVLNSEGAPWLAIARSYDGLREIKGKEHAPEILEFWELIGHPEIRDDETAWCAAFAGACLEKAGFASTKSTMAKSYISWGKVLNKPKLGAIAIFNRTGNPAFGHVGFYVGEDAKNVFVLGGNQSDAVNVGKFPKSRLVGYRWPVTPSNSRTVRAASLGIASAATLIGGTAILAGMAQVGEATLPIGAELKSLSDYYPVLGFVGGLINILAYLMILYARIDDLRNKGR